MIKNLASPIYLPMFVFIVLHLNLAYGTTIARVGTEELINRSELIFEGEVIAVRPKQDQRGYIYTYVDFMVIDVLAGAIENGSYLTLRFTGGTVGDTRLNVGARIPALNERGIYFVEQIAPGLVNPLLGWTQGHFTIGEDGSVVAGNTQKVLAIQRKNRERLEVSHGVAIGILTERAANANDTSLQRSSSEANSHPMSVKEFKERIRELRD